MVKSRFSPANAYAEFYHERFNFKLSSDIFVIWPLGFASTVPTLRDDLIRF